MTTHAGSEGTFKIGTDLVAEIKSWSIDETDETLDTTALGKTWRTRQPMNIKSWTGSLEGFYDPSDVAQGQLVAGAEVTLNLYYMGETTGAEYMTGSAIVNTVSLNASFDGMLEVSFSFEGNGALTRSTVA